MRDAVEDGRPFAVAFIDLHMPPGLDGLQTAEQIRALDPDIQIVIASVHCDIHPVEMSERIPPAEQLYYLRKPFHSIELQQLMLALGARWRSEHSFSGGGRTAVGVTSWRGHSSMAETLQQLPAAILVFDRRDRLLSANDEAAKLFPELAEFFVPGTRYEEIQRQMALQLLPKDTLYRVESWIGDRLEWHARSGGILEQRLRGSRWVLLVEGAAPSGETYCMYYDITDLKRRETNRATTNHMTQMAQSFAALCQRLETISRAAREEQERGSARRRPEMQVAHLSGRWAAGGRDGPVQSLTAQLQAVAQCQSLKPESVGLNRIVGEVVRQMRGELPTAVDLEVIAGAGLWPVLIDKVQFAVALSELIRNAAEAMSAGGPL
ncbi:MAG: PAS-domain containing protein, partial [Kiloniellaceae bacterium]